MGAAVLALLVCTSCNVYGYTAHIDSVSVGSYLTTITGWVHDPFLAKRPSSYCAVVTATNSGDPALGVGSATGFCEIAQEYAGGRPDVDKALGPTNWSLKDRPIAERQPRGTYKACINITPIGSAIQAQPLDCITYTVPFDQFDNSAIDTVHINGTTLTASGWYSHVPLNPDEASGWWSIDGLDVPTAGTIVTTVDRPDVIEAVGPGGRGYTLSTSVSPGQHNLCIGVRVPAGATVGFGVCQSFTVSR